MTHKPKKSSKRKTTTSSSKKKSGVVLVRPRLDFSRPPEEQEEALDAFVDSFVEELKKPG